MNQKMEQLKKRIAVASKDQKADLVIKGGTIVDVYNLRLFEADVAIVDGVIAGIGSYEGEKVVDAKGKFIAPSFIDGHVHIESSMVRPSEFAKAVLPHGVTTVITDPHEIANVSGKEGIRFMLEDSEGLDLDVYVMLPSCVPATSFENAGAVLNQPDLEPFYQHPRVLGLAEVMDYPSVKNRDEKMLEKLLAATFHRNQIDGHCSGFDEDAINVYRSSGITTDHESVDRSEIDMRITRGMYVMLREGTTTKNVRELIHKVTPNNARRFLFCTDDKHIDDLIYEGSIDHNIRLAIESGMDPLQAIQLATLNAAECFRLYDRGAVIPGYRADLVILGNLEKISIEQVYKDGRLVAKEGKYIGEYGSRNIDISDKLMDSVQIGEIKEEQLQIKLGESGLARVIGVVPEQVVTKHLIEKVAVKDGLFFPDGKKDISKLVVVERHKGTGNVGLGIVKGLGLTSGAIASTVAHDSHNLVVAGTTDTDILVAIETVKQLKGGLVVVNHGEVIGKMELSISGLLSDRDFLSASRELKQLNAALDKILSKPNPHLFIALSFLSLPVIPSLKLTDQGLFDVDIFSHVNVGIQE